MSVRVLIADDDALTRAALRTIIDAHDDIELVGEACDGVDAVEQAAQPQPDVLLLDIRMPNLDGLEAARQILASKEKRPRVIMLTTFDLDEYVYEALKAGATGFLRKDAPPERLLAFIRSTGADDALLDPTITRRLIERYGPSPARQGSSRSVGPWACRRPPTTNAPAGSVPLVRSRTSGCSS
jgi:DNA-binding NarL/FixJ family response regulator